MEWDINFATDYGEIFGFIAMVLAFIMAVSTGSANIAYLGALITGLLAGQRWFNVRKGPRFIWYFIIVGFAIGYTIGSMFFADVKVVIALFVLGMVIGWMFRKKANK